MNAPGTTARGLSARIAAFTAALLVTVVVPASAAQAATAFEAESLTIDPAYGSAYQDASASGGWALAIWNNAAATGTFTASTPFSTLSVTAMGGICGATDANPRMQVAVDGVALSEVAVGGSWSDYSWNGSWAAGNHSVSFRFLNEFGDGTCDRFLEVDAYKISTAPAGFITRSGSQLMLGGRAFKYAGLNAFGLSGCDNNSVPWTDAQLNTYFSQLAPNTVTRTWAFQPYGLPVLDRIVAAAARYDQKVSLTLADGRNYCGEEDGMSAGEGSDKTIAWYQGGFRTNYLPWANSVVSRFKDNTSVAWWELINEPGSQDNPAYTDAIIKAFFDEAAAAIKAVDRNHLVATGTMYQATYGTSNFAYVHSGPNIDIASLHEYEYDWQNSNAIISGHLAPALSAMQSINKPLIVGETGLYAAPSGCRTTLAGRASVITQKLNGYLAYNGVAGVNAWAIVLYNPVTAQEPCPLEGRVNDPMIASVRTKQAALNG